MPTGVSAARLSPRIEPHASFAGRAFDLELLKDLPSGVDPCGENGEFHTFVTDGPIFRTPLACTPGGIVRRGDHIFADLLLGS